MTFTKYHKDDTTLERDGDVLVFSFIGDMFTMEEQDHLDFYDTQDRLFWMLGEYYDTERMAYSDIFDELTPLGLEALWSALLWMNQNNIEL